MNIDTLNAYCGIKLVLFPYLIQGRFNIYQALLELDSLWLCAGVILSYC